MSYRGVEVSIEGQQHVPSAVGPMTRSLNSMIAVTKLVIEAEHWKLDSQLPPMPWRNDVFETLSSRPLVIGIMPDDDVVKPLPPVARVFRETVAKLQAAGHEIVEWDVSLNRRCIAVQVSHFQIFLHLRLTVTGRVLLCRRWRRHSDRRDARRRTVRAADTGFCKSWSRDLSLPVLASEQTEGRSSTGISRNVEQYAI